MAYQIKPLSCDPAKIKGMSERLIVSHYENNYGGAVKRLNLIEEQLAELDYAKAAGFLINGVKREQLIAMNSMILHELFFDGLGEQSEPGASAARRAGAGFRIVRALARGVRGDGQGARRRLRVGAVVVVAPRPQARQPVGVGPLPHLAGGTPILALDMYEHSYHIDFGAKAASYVDTFMDAIRWANVERAIWANDRRSRDGGRDKANEVNLGGRHHACCLRACDLRRGDNRRRRQGPGDRLEEGR